MARVEQLSDGARVALRVAACAGASVPHRLLSATAGLPELELEDAVREAVTHHVLVRSGGDAYAFRHALLREAVYADVLPGERARLHAAIARALTDAPDLASEGAAVAAAELAHHWKAAHELGEALAASVDAGRAAARIAAFPEAQRHFEYALDVWDRVEGAEARAGMDRIDLTRRAADAAHLAADRERAIALARDAAARVDAAPRPGPRRAACTSGWAATSGSWAATTRPRRPTARRSPRCRPIRPAPNARGSSRPRASCSCCAAAHVRRSRAARRRSPSPARSARAPRRGMRSTRSARCRSGLGEHEAGEACLREALAIALELQLLDDVGRAYVNLSDCVDQAGRIDEAAQLALDGFEAGRSLGLGTGYRAMLLSEAAQRRFRAGRWDDAERLAGQALALRAGGLVEGVAHATVAQRRGRARRSRRRAGRLRACARDVFKADASAMWNAPVDAGAAELELSAGRAGRGAGRGQRRAGAQPRARSIPFYTARLHWVGLRVEAELAEEARARFDRAGGARGAGPGGGRWPSGSPGRSPRRARHARARAAPLRRRCARPS